MTKAVDTAIQLSAIVVIYFLFYTGFIPTPAIVQNEIIPVLPWWGLVSFGAYSLATLGWGIFSFKDKKAEYHTLLKVCCYFWNVFLVCFKCFFFIEKSCCWVYDYHRDIQATKAVEKDWKKKLKRIKYH